MQMLRKFQGVIQGPHRTMIETFHAFGTRLGSREAPFKFTIHRNHEESNANNLGLEQTFFTDRPV